MKLFLCLIFLALSLIGCTKSTQISNQYVNFVAYGDSKCEQLADNGFGYSIAADTCTTFDHYNNTLFTVDNGQISWASYENTYGDEEVCTNPITPTQTYSIGSCISPSVVKFYPNSGVTDKTFYFKLTISSTPYIPPTSYVNSLMGGSCVEENIVALQYVINNTRIYLFGSSNTYLYYCNPSNNYPVFVFCIDHSSQCSPSGNPSPPRCLEIPPFYNSSSDSSYTTACYHQCCSGTCSGTGTGAYTSGGGSYTGEGWVPSETNGNQDVALKNNQNKKATVQTNLPTYYQKSYCS
ncbi:hypothetical protein RB653_009476 [Dictyostelium firmibasis]|uniref:Lipoprotein n=1 Tax=Dictyostelium firmibasis TaxID=79012 RepID=A0AAN7TU49_9MYCE